MSRQKVPKSTREIRKYVNIQLQLPTDQGLYVLLLFHDVLFDTILQWYTKWNVLNGVEAEGKERTQKSRPYFFDVIVVVVWLSRECGTVEIEPLPCCGKF